MASLAGNFNIQEFTDLGALAVGGRIYTYVQGSTTHKNAYTDLAGTTPHTYTSDGLGGQYIALNARGELPAPLYLSAGAYDITYKTPAGATVWTRRADPIGDDLAASSGAGLVGYIAPETGAVATTLQAKQHETRSIKDFGGSLAAALTGIGSTAMTLIINDAVAVTVDTVVPSTLTIEVKNGAVITISAGKTLTINGTFQAGVFQCFAGSGLVVFGEGAAVEYYPEWWLASGGEFGAAASKCFTATATAGAKVVFTKSHTCTTPINMTSNHYGWVVEGRGGSGASPDWGVTIAFSNTGVGFDCSASEHIHFSNFKIKGGAIGTITTYPSVGFLFARNAAGSGCGKHTMTNVMTAYGSKFSTAALYNYGAEEMVFDNCHFYNFVASKETVILTAYNTYAITSSFLTLGSGVMSTTVMKFNNGAYWSSGGTASTFYMDGIAEIHIDGPLLLNDGGYCLFYVNCANAPTADVSIRGIRDEGQATGATNGIRFDGGAQTPLNWTVEENVFRVATNVLYSADAVTPQNINYSKNTDSGAKGISVKSMTFSHIDNQQSVFTGRAGGTLTSCEIKGNYDSMTFSGSLTNTRVIDYQYNSLYFPSVGSVNYPIGTLTLTANAATTTITTVPFIKTQSRIFLTPTSANAAADQGSATGVWVSAIVAGASFTLTHPNNANADKTFNYMIITGS